MTSNCMHEISCDDEEDDETVAHPAQSNVRRHAAVNVCDLLEPCRLHCPFVTAARRRSVCGNIKGLQLLAFSVCKLRVARKTHV